MFRKLFTSIYPAVAILLVFILLAPVSTKGAEKKKFVVVIDAGHGGTDHGAIENGFNEKDVTLDVALKLGNLIKKKLKDTEVIYTRSTDQFISLQKRADVANKAKADLFISIHCNSVDRSNKNRANVSGATTYVLGHHKDDDNLAVARRENAVVELDANDKTHYSEFDPSSVESNIIFEMTQKKNFQNSIRLATDIQREMTAIGRVSRGVQQAGFWVLWSTAAPAVLVELDFLCNPQQAKYLGSKEGQDKLAGAIFNAVKKYESYFRMSLGMTRSGASDPQIAEAHETSEELKVAELKSEEKPAVAGGTAVLASSGPRQTKKQTQAARTQSAKKTSDGSHRRRSAAAREEGASQIEQVQIAMTEEVAFGPEADYPSTDEASEAPVKQSGKKAAKGRDKNEKKEVAKPGRRDKDKKTGRKGVKQSVNVDYRILLFVSDVELAANHESFHGLKPVASFRENNKFKYTYGESADRKEMDTLLREISDLFPEARVIKCYY